MDGRMRLKDLSVKLNCKFILAAVLVSLCMNLSAEELKVYKADFSMVKNSIKWLEKVKSGVSRETRKKIFSEKVMVTSGADSILKYWKNIGYKGSGSLDDYFFHLLKKRNVGRHSGLNFIPKEWYERSRRLLLNLYRNLPLYNKLLEKLINENVMEKALKLVENYLPEHHLIDVKLEVVIFGYSLAFSVDGKCVYDFLQLPLDKKKNILIDEVVETIAHEIHHLEFDKISRTGMADVANKEKLSLIWLLASEGMATFYIDRPFCKLNEFKKREDALYRRIASDWIKHTSNLNVLYIEAQEDIEKSLAGEISLSAICWKWSQGVKGAVYILGSDMISVINEFSGKESVMEIISDYRKLIAVYNKAAVKGNSLGNNFFVFSRDLEKKITGFTE